MMIVKFQPEHVTRIRLQPRQNVSAYGPMDADYGRELARSGPAVTGMHGDEILFCGGKVKTAEGHWIIWALLSEAASRHMLRITRVAERLIALQDAGSVLYAVVERGFHEAARWVKILGFEAAQECPGGLPDGSDAVIYRKAC